MQVDICRVPTHRNKSCISGSLSWLSCISRSISGLIIQSLSGQTIAIINWTEAKGKIELQRIVNVCVITQILDSKIPIRMCAISQSLFTENPVLKVRRVFPKCEGQHKGVMEGERFQLRWNDFHANISKNFRCCYWPWLVVIDHDQWLLDPIGSQYIRGFVT